MGIGETPHPWNEEQGDCGADAASDSRDQSERLLRIANDQVHAVPESNKIKDCCCDMI